MAKESEKVQKKRPTAQKRDIQNEKKRLINKSFRSKVRTTVRILEETVAKKEDAQEQLNQAYSVIDKAVKRGLYQKNKGNRKKARLAAKAKVTT